MIFYDNKNLSTQKYILNKILSNITYKDIVVTETKRDVPYNIYTTNTTDISCIFSPVYDNFRKQYITQIVIGRHYDFDKDKVTINIPNCEFLERLKQLSQQRQLSSDVNNHNKFLLLTTEYQKTK